MRFHRFVIALAVLLIASAVSGQDWVEYTSREDRFTVLFPAQPAVRAFTYTSWREAQLPARTHSVQRGADRYSVTVVDYTVAERVHTERAKTCEAGAHTLCRGNDLVSQGVGGWKYDVHGALDHASSEFLMRNAKVTYFAWATIDRITGRQIHLTNADQSRTFAQIHMHENRLYIVEATVPAQAPEPGLFQQSPRFLDAAGRPVRYTDNYANMYPPPPRAGQN